MPKNFWEYSPFTQKGHKKTKLHCLRIAVALVGNKNMLARRKNDYRWSSHLDWWGIKNFPSLIDAGSMTRFFKNSEEYREFFIDWLKYYEKNIGNLSRLLIIE